VNASPLRIALLGYGFIGRMHEQAARACGQHVVRIARSTDDWAAAVTARDVDAVVVATPNALHHPQALAALAAGKHVLVDKPMALSVAQAREIADAAATAGRTLLVGHMWRYRDEVIAARDAIAAGAVGTPVHTIGYGVHAGWGPTGWFTDHSLSGGGALIDMGIHAIDTARFLLGDPRPRRVSAVLRTAFGDAHGYARDSGIDDDGLVVVEWTGGALAIDGAWSAVHCGWWQPRLEGVEADTDVRGTTGALRIWPDLLTDGALPAGYVHCDLPMYTTQMADFVRCCRSGETPVASAEVGLTAMTIVEDAYRVAGFSTVGPMNSD
jgi:predicted dehydrogenase